MTQTIKAYAALQFDKPLNMHEIFRRDPGEKDMEIEILYCGVCHSDIHQARNEWHNTVYLCVPRHEIVGHVTKVGSKASKFREGDTAAVGCLVGSCRRCNSCKGDLEQHCEQGSTFTYRCSSAKRLTFPTRRGNPHPTQPPKSLQPIRFLYSQSF